jgi:DNA-binding response OmpR family regulator
MSKTKRILVVDDQQGINNLLRIKLGHSGYEVITTTSGAEAVEICRAQKPDIMLLDFLMPGMSGFEVLEQVRAFSSLPIIAFSARKEVAESAIKKGADDYITKPFDPDKLVEKIGSILDRTGGA